MSERANIATQRRERYWRRVQRLTAVLILLWFLMTFGIVFFARELSAITVLGWPISFYMAAQGLTLFYLVIVAVYVIRMQHLDKILKDDGSDGQ